MREILFRGQTRRRGERFKMNGEPLESNWVYGGIFPNCGGDFAIIYQQKPEIEKYTVYAETVGQYIGLRDKNGKKIFEGDIVTGHIANYEKITGAIVYNSAAGFFIDRKGLRGIGLNCAGDWVEVIGNIHDNPELLEAQV